MPGTHQASDQFLLSTLISGSIYQQDVAGSTAVDTTINSYATAGLFATIQFIPTTTQTVTATVPTAPSTAANKGWRYVTATDASNQITWDAVNWTVRLRMLSSAAQSTLVTVILYGQNGSGTTEIGRGTATLALTATIQTAIITVPASTGLVFAAGDKIQTEIYTTTLLLGTPTPPTLATTITCRVGESDINFGAKLTPGTYSIQAVRAATTAATIVGKKGSVLINTIAKVAVLGLATAVVKNVILNAKASTLTLGTNIVKNIRVTKATALSLAVAIQKNVGIFRTTAVSITAAFSRIVLAYRTFTTALTLNVVFARFITSVRKFTTSVAFTASGLVQISLTILNRLSGGGTTIIKKIINIFDD